MLYIDKFANKFPILIHDALKYAVGNTLEEFRIVADDEPEGLMYHEDSSLVYHIDSSLVYHIAYIDKSLNYAYTTELIEISEIDNVTRDKYLNDDVIEKIVDIIEKLIECKNDERPTINQRYKLISSSDEIYEFTNKIKEYLKSIGGKQ